MMKIKHYVTQYYPLSEEQLATYDRLWPDDNIILIHHDQSTWNHPKLRYVQDCPVDVRHACEWTTLWQMRKDCDNLAHDDIVQHSHYRKFISTGCVATPYCFHFTDNKQWTLHHHPAPVWELLEDSILKDADWKEEANWNRWSRLLYMPAPCCVFRLTVSDFNAMFDWAWPHLISIENRIPYLNKEFQTEYQRRALSFVGERLFSYWVYSRRPDLLRFESPLIQIRGFKPISDEEERTLQLKRGTTA